jgi:hypothetical protein
MPRVSSQLPKFLNLIWGNDRIEVSDPIWIERILMEAVQNGRPGYPPGDDRIGLCEPGSVIHNRPNHNFEVDAGQLKSLSVADQVGYQAPEHQGGVAVEALKVFLGVELPIALSVTVFGERSEHRMSAVRATFCLPWDDYIPNAIQWKFSGYEIHANHQIGAAHNQPLYTDVYGLIERRLLSGQWVCWSFDGASIPPVGQNLPLKSRRFLSTASGTNKVVPICSDLNAWRSDHKN